MSHVSVIRRYLLYYAQLKMQHLSPGQAMQRIRGFIDLVFDLTEKVTHLVEETHDKVVQRTLRRFASLEPVTTAVTAVTGIETAISETVFKSIRGINTIPRLSLNTAADLAETGTGKSLDDEGRAVTTPMQPSAAGTPGWAVDYAQSSINGLWGVLRNVEAAGAQVPARILDSRSAGVKDLRYGYTVNEEWAGKDPNEVFADARRNIPLVDGVGYYFVAATISRDLQHPLGQLLGDLLVRLPSATCEAPETARRIEFARDKVFPGMNHIHIANHPDIYEALRELVAP